jgi:hypothetical protein
MSRKQFLILIIALVVLGAAGGALMWSERSAWDKSDARVGQKLLPEFKAAEVAQIILRDGQGQVSLVKDGEAWKVKERADFPVEMGRLADLLNKIAGLDVTQTQALTAAERPGFMLLDPDAKDKAADKGGAGKTGTVMELKNAAGKPMARLLLGRTVIKRVNEPPAPGEQPKEFDKAVGRHLLSGTDEKLMIVVSDGLIQAEAKPEAWVAKEVLHVDRTRGISVVGPDGAPRYSVVRKEEGDWWNFGDGGERPDQQKAQDSVSPLYAVNIVDVVADPKNEVTGLDKAVVAKAETFDNLTYTIRIGNKVPGAKPEDNRYYVTFSIAGDPPKERVAFKDEKPEDKEKKAKEWVEYRVKLLEQVEREKGYSKWTFLFPARPIEPLLRTRAEMLQEKKPRK